MQCRDQWGTGWDSAIKWLAHAEQSSGTNPYSCTRLRKEREDRKDRVGRPKCGIHERHERQERVEEVHLRVAAYTGSLCGNSGTHHCRSTL